MNEELNNGTTDVLVADEILPANDDGLEEMDSNSELPSFITDDNRRQFQLLNMKSHLNDITKLKENINKQCLEYVDDESGEKLDELILSKSIEELKALTDKEVEDIYNNPDNPITLSIDFGNDKKKEIAFKKDYLLFRHQSITAMEKFDDELNKITAEIAEAQEEFDAVCKEFGNVTNLIRSNLQKNIENAKDDKTRELYKKIEKYFEYGFSLDNLKEYVKSYRGKNIIGDYYNDKKSMYIYRSYKKVVNSFNIKTDLSDNIFYDIEKKFLESDNKLRSNIFIFSVIHYIASWNNKNVDRAHGLFITQFTVNMKNLIFDKFEDIDERNKFIENITDVVKNIG